MCIADKDLTERCWSCGDRDDGLPRCVVRHHAHLAAEHRGDITAVAQFEQRTTAFFAGKKYAASTRHNATDHVHSLGISPRAARFSRSLEKHRIVSHELPARRTRVIGQEQKSLAR